MKISDNGLALIKKFEDCRLHAYQDSVGVWTIGYGHTQSVHPGMQIDQHTADVFLAADALHVCVGMAPFIHVALNQNQIDALADFAFNLGVGALAHSTLLHFVNEGHFAQAAEQFTRWNHAGVHVLAGLTRRREAEKELFLRPEIKAEIA